MEALATAPADFPLLALLQLLPLGTAILVLAVRRERPAIAIGVLMAATELALSLYIYRILDQGSAVLQLAERWTPIPPINYHAGADGVSVLFILLTALLCLLVVVYGSAWRLRPASHFLAVVLAIEATLMSLFTTLDLIWFLAASAVELGLVGYLLWRFATSPAKGLALTRFYQFMGTGLALLLAGILMLGWNHADASGGAWSFDLTELANVPVNPTVSSLIFFLLFYGLAIRTPLFPFHGWLPLVAWHGNVAVAPTILLGLKVGIYGMVRFVFPILPEAVVQWSPYVVAFATAGIFYAALLALIQANLRRLLAFAVVSHTSILVIGLFSLGQAAFQGSLMLSVSFGLAIAGLFFMTGLVYRRTRTTQLEKLGGLFDRIPVIGVAFFIAGLSIVGMPGTPGFDAAHLILEASIDRFGAVETIAAALGNVAAAGFLLWAFQRAFLAPRSPESQTKIAPATIMERAIAGILVVVLLGAGFYSEPWLKLVDAPMASLSARFPPG
ncbi:MAG: NADH-quinone oxidoreductase subunit M [Chromatiaceae bacterium]|nr:NADH-quinone oxidoreductase subunit M [Chromatiaceae bacterium]